MCLLFPSFGRTPQEQGLLFLFSSLGLEVLQNNSSYLLLLRAQEPLLCSLSGCLRTAGSNTLGILWPTDCSLTLTHLELKFCKGIRNTGGGEACKPFDHLKKHPLYLGRQLLRILEITESALLSEGWRAEEWLGYLPVFFQMKGFALLLERRYNRVVKNKDLDPENLDLTHGSNTFNSLIYVNYLTSLYLNLFRYKMGIIKVSLL